MRESTIPSFHPEYAYGLCHALTAAFFSLAGSGEALALTVAGEIRHTVYRPVNTPVYLDAHGLTTDLRQAASRYTHSSESWRWEPIAAGTVESLAAGGNRTRLRRLVRAARPIAARLLALA